MTNDELIKKVAYLLNNDGIMDDDYYLSSAEEIIAIVTAHNHEAARAAVNIKRRLKLGKGKELAVLGKGVNNGFNYAIEAIDNVFNSTGDSNE